MDQPLLDVHDWAGATLVPDLLAVAEQDVVEDRVVAQARGAVAVGVDQVEGAEPDVEAEGLGLGGGWLGLGGGAGDGDPAEQQEQGQGRASKGSPSPPVIKLASKPSR